MVLGAEPRIGGDLVRALEEAWETIRVEHPDVPAVVIVTGQGSSRRRGSPLRLGQFAAARWQPGAGELAEVMVGGEGLARGGRDVLGTLLHEAAHALAAERKINDTSREGRYHNRRFKTLGEEVGLTVERHELLGWAITEVGASTAGAYASTIAALERAIVAYRDREQPRPEQARPGAVMAICGCGRRIRIARSVLSRGPIVCGVCSQPFGMNPTHQQTAIEA
jgi:hypothetical protein